MSEDLLTGSRIPHERRDTGIAPRLWRKAVLGRLQGLKTGRLIIEDGGSRTSLGQDARELQAVVKVHDPAFYEQVALAGSIGAGEAYMQGHWSTDDLTTLVRLLVRNREVLDRVERGLARLSAPVFRTIHRLRRNSRRGSRRNIAAHYDLGNDFFRLFLDGNMMYSSAVFEDDGMSLEQASEAKLERICRKLRLSPTDHVLEIGTGWGGFALHAARRFGCRVTTTTISREQHREAQARVRKAGLEDRVEVLLRDYRDLDGRYSKLVSIEMIEAVGHQYYDAFFRQCSHLLAADGMMLLQAITIEDHRYEQARRSVDFIQRYIFPGSCIPAVSVLCSAAARAGHLRLSHLEDIGLHYARTLRCWRERFQDNRKRIRALGYPESMLRMWEFYLCYCEGGFLERSISDVQMLLVKPGCRETAPLGGLD